MNGAIQNRINPITPKNTIDFSDAKIKNSPKAIDSNSTIKTSFKDLILNSNNEMAKEREAQKNGDGLSAAKSDAEFSKLMSDRINKDNQRTPQNSLDKDAFLKLFMTQMQNQDPLNPDDSSEMASQLAQFNGLEQMMNVNKNLEKLHAEQALSRAVGLTSFVDKEIKITGGRAMLKSGQISNIQAKIERDMPQSILEVRNGAGVLIANRELGGFKAGEQKVRWDGLDEQGKKVADGLYSLSISGKDMSGQPLTAELSSIVTVRGVDLREAGGIFHTDIGPVKVSEIAEVGNAKSDFEKNNGEKVKIKEENTSSSTSRDEQKDVKNGNQMVEMLPVKKSVDPMKEKMSKLTSTGEIIAS